MFTSGFHGAMQPRWPAVEVVRRSSCVHTVQTQGRCRPFLEGPNSYVRCAWSTCTAYVGSTMLWQVAWFERYV